MGWSPLQEAEEVFLGGGLAWRMIPKNKIRTHLDRVLVYHHARYRNASAAIFAAMERSHAGNLIHYFSAKFGIGKEDSRDAKLGFVRGISLGVRIFSLHEVVAVQVIPMWGVQCGDA